MNDDRLSILNASFPGRKQQIERLCRFFPENQDRKLVDYVSIEGDSGSGRTAIIRKLMDINKEFYILINCLECHSNRLLYFHLLYGLYHELQEEYEQVDSVSVVYDHFQKFEDKRKLHCIILKNSHTLNEFVLECLCELHKLLILDGWNFSLVFVSENCSHLVQLRLHFVSICFPPYSKDELIEILCLDEREKDSENSLEIFRNFLQFFLPTVAPIYNDLPSIKRLVRKFFPVYRKPIDDGEMTENQQVPLNKCFVSKIKLQEFFLIYSRLSNGFLTKVNDMMDLPLCTKYLLVAAYLASFVPKSKDKMFTMTSSKKRKRITRTNKDKEENALLTGPKPFKFSRLMFIYKAILGQKLRFNVDLILKVAALLELGLLAYHGDPHRENLGDPQYKCRANPSCVHAIAENIKVDLKKYLT